MPTTFERCASPESIPHLEVFGVLGDDSLHDPSTTGSLASGSMNQKLDHEHEFSQVIRDGSTQLKLGLVLENKGSVARDHLASERTYLAYVRTSLACASAGIALLQLLTMSAKSNVPTNGVDLVKFARPLGATVTLFGLIILIFGLTRFYTTQSALIHGYFPVAQKSITIIAFMLGSLVGIVFTIIFIGTQS